MSPQLTESLQRSLLSSLIKHEHEPVSISKTRHIVHGVESTRVVEHILDPSECVEHPRDSGSHRASKRVLRNNALLGQTLLHELGSEEGEATVDGVLDFRLAQS